MSTTTAAQRRAIAKAEYDAFLDASASRALVDRISDKWVTLVLCALSGGPTGDPRPLRFSELSRQLAGASQKMLTQTLRSLERDGLVSRTVTPTVPVTVTYEVTELGVSLYLVVRELKTWAEHHMGAIRESRAAYDAREA